MDVNATLRSIFQHLFHEGGDYAECLELIEAMAKWIADDGFAPHDDDCDWSDILIGSYWFCGDYHSGQWSDEYRLQCVIGQESLFVPGPCCSGPEPESMESEVYSALESLSGYDQLVQGRLKWHSEQKKGGK